MYYLDKTLDAFIDALQSKNSIRLKPTGYWRYRGALSSLLEKIIGTEERHHLELTKAFISCLDRLESIPIHFSHHGHPEQQETDFRAYILASKMIENLIIDYPSPEMKKLFYQLKRRIYGLLYRLEATNGGFKKYTGNEEMMKKLKQEALNWKREQKVFWKKELTHADKQHLEAACRYKKVV